MKRILMSAVILGVLALALGFGADTERRAEAAPLGAAWNVSVSNVGPNQASFQWNPSGWGVQQWVDISHWNGFYWQWQNAGPFGTWASSYTWSGLLSNTTYYVRVNTGLWDGTWLASDWAGFVTTQVAAPCYGNTLTITPYVVPQVINCPQSWVRIWTNRGDGASYFINEAITVCYSVSAPMYIRIVDILANGSQQTFLQGNDDGRGDCLPAQVTPPSGLERLVIYGASGASDSTYFYVR